MMRKPGRKIDAAPKAKIALEALRGDGGGPRRAPWGSPQPDLRLEEAAAGPLDRFEMFPGGHW